MRNFTLKELLIVVSLTLLLGNLVSIAATKKSKEAEIFQCAFNLKKLGTAIFSFTNDNDGFLPQSSYFKDNWKMKIMPYLLGKDAKNVKKAIPYFTCPSNKSKFPQFMQNNPSYIGQNSYCANAYLIDIDSVDVNKDYSDNAQNLKKIYGPDTIIFFAEDHTKNNAIGLGPSIRIDKAGDFEYPTEAKNGYHNLKSNYLMLDGGVEFNEYLDTVNTHFNKWIIRFEYRRF
jgi:prepilin-type processing-associated H-X9-DG protein